MASDSRPIISVVIPVKNGSATIEAALQGLLAQTLADRTEIILIDSGSRDDTLDIARRYPVIVHQIPAAEFNHGATRNLGVKLARGDFVVMTVQDAAPADTHWLATMLRHFDDPEVAGVCGKQITTHDLDKNPMEWHRPMGEPQVTRLQFATRQDYEALPGPARMAASAWDDVTAMYRKSVLLDLPFRTTMFGEDFFWANDALALGHALVHDDNAMVWHYHDQPFSFRFRRQLTTCQHQLHIYEHITPPQNIWRKAAQSTWHLSRHQMLSWSQKGYWLYYNLRLCCADWSAHLIARGALALAGSAGLDRVHAHFCPGAPQAIARPASSAGSKTVT